jgi:type I site-specific restriction endonuclease
LHTPFVFASNGDAFLFHDRTGLSEQRESQFSLETFPGPEELWRRYCQWKGLSDERQQLYREFTPDFFDLIVVDECHRGSADEDSAWREILEYFSSAAQLGLTAIPKETKYVSNIHYFGKSIYSASLRQGIRDGFLAPYKVIRVLLDIDVHGYQPERGAVDKDGQEIEDRQYNQKDSDRVLVIDERTRRIARWITEYLKASGDRFQPTIVFCVDTGHALLMRQALINENQDLVQRHPHYIMRITGNDSEGTSTSRIPTAWPKTTETPRSCWPTCRPSSRKPPTCATSSRQSWRRRCCDERRCVALGLQ